MSINDKVEEAIALIKELDDVAYKFREDNIVEDKFGDPTPESWDKWDDFYEKYPKFRELAQACDYLTSRSRADESDL